ncbi:MAG TPA: ABC transporter permease [Acetobacteraceae bacterium]|nr:ABC transporter permease [Acetobacteraceae bacterium]
MQAEITRNRAGYGLANLRRYRQVFLLGAIVAVATGVSDGRFLQPENLIVVIASASAFGLVSFGQALVVIGGGFDLSVGSLVAMCISAIVYFRGDFGIVGGTAAALLVVVGAGLVNGFVITRTKIPSFIVTLGMLSIAESMSWLLAAGQPITVSEFNDGIAPLFSWLPLGENVFPIIALAVGFGGTALLLHRSRWGRYIYAIGANEAAARITGVPLRATKMLTYGLSGLLCWLAAVVYLYQNVSATPGEGADYLLLSFAATMVGGVYMYGGDGSIPGTLVGVLCLASVTSALTIAGVAPSIYQGVVGLIVLTVVLFQARIRK